MTMPLSQPAMKVPAQDAKISEVAQTMVDDGHPEGEMDVNHTVESSDVPLHMKIIAVALVTAIGFGSHWSTGVTGAMKSTLKKELHINNTEYAVLTSSEDFIKTALILIVGIVTDKVGGANAMLYGNALYTIGSIIVAAATNVRSYKVMIAGTVVQAFGDVATQVCQYKVFSSWFPPSSGFATVLGFELGMGKIGSFVGQASANVIAKNTGDFSWTYWTAVFMNFFTNAVSLIFWLFTNYSMKRFGETQDPATGEKLTEKNKKFEISKMLRLPWTFWGIIAFTAFQTSLASVFSANATELSQQRFDVDAIRAGWYSSMSQYLGFFLVPLLGLFIDTLGQRISVLACCGSGCFVAMCLAKWGPSKAGLAASFGIYAVSFSFGPTAIIDAIRCAMWWPEVFGSGYAIKIAVNNSMSIIISILSGVLQDADNDSYDRVIVIYVFLGAGAVLVSATLLGLSTMSIDLRLLQWPRKHRMQSGHILVTRRERFESGDRGRRNRRFGQCSFTAVIFLIFGAWSAYFWGIATGNSA